MAMPVIFYPLLKGGTYLTIENAVAETREDIINFDQTDYRDTNTPIAAIGSILQGSGQASGSGSTVTAALVSTTGGTIGATSPIVQDDAFTHVAPRMQAFRRTMIRWWKVKTSTSKDISGNATLASAEIVVASIAGIGIGQTITGTGLPLATPFAIVQDVRAVISSTGAITYVIVASVASTAVTGPQTYTLGDGFCSDLAGECWADRFLGWSSQPPAR